MTANSLLSVTGASSAQEVHQMQQEVAQLVEAVQMQRTVRLSLQKQVAAGQEQLEAEAHRRMRAEAQLRECQQAAIAQVRTPGQMVQSHEC